MLCWINCLILFSSVFKRSKDKIWRKTKTSGRCKFDMLYWMNAWPCCWWPEESLGIDIHLISFFLLLDSGSSRGPGDIRPWSSWTSWDQVEPPGQADQQDRVPQTLSAGVLQHIQGRLDCKCWYLFIQMTQRKKKQIHARKWRFDSSKSLYCIVNSMSVAPHFLFWLSLWNLLLEQPW